MKMQVANRLIFRVLVNTVAVQCSSDEDGNRAARPHTPSLAAERSVCYAEKGEKNGLMLKVAIYRSQESKLTPFCSLPVPGGDSRLRC